MNFRAGRRPQGRLKKNVLWAGLTVLTVSLQLCWACLPTRSRTLGIQDYPQLMRAKVVELARALRGRPYRSGGDEIDGWDCSGFVRYVFHAFGYQVPRQARAYARLKPNVPLRFLQPADVLVFRLKGSWHLGIYSGDNRFVHAPSRGQRVREETINSYWKDELVRVVRIIADR